MSTTREERDAAFTISADGAGRDRVGSNQDPCVFAEPLSIFHSFCKIDHHSGDTNVKEDKSYGTGQGRVLSEVVKPDDVIFYGFVGLSRGRLQRVFIDTVLVVDRVILWPTTEERGVERGKPYRLLRDERLPRALNVAMSFAELCRTNAWAWNLADEEFHSHSALERHRIIVGKAEPTKEALSARKTSFVTLWQGGTSDDPYQGVLQLKKEADPALWSDLAKAILHGDATGSYKPRFEISDIADRLYDAVLACSPGGVGIPPFTPTKAQPPSRSGPSCGRATTTASKPQRDGDPGPSCGRR